MNYKLTETPEVFQKDLNTNNALGLNGKMAISFAMLLRKIWKNNSSFISPNQLRDHICTKYPHFRGYEQQDTHEFMCSLLSVLHEDLNRVLKKPFYETNIECNSDMFENTTKIADDSWNRFLTRENSIITDNFYGQFKSKLTCPMCNKISITFEPFSNFLVPLPNPKKPQPCIAVPITGTLLKFKLNIGENDTIEDMKIRTQEYFENFQNKHLSVFILNQRTIESNDGQEVCVFELNSNWEELPLNQKVPKLRANQVFIIYETNDPMKSTEPSLEIRVQQVCKFPLLNSNALEKCASCHQSPYYDEETREISTLLRCTRCYRSAYCNGVCQKNDWSNHRMKVCAKPLDSVGLPFIVTFHQNELLDDIDFEALLNYKLDEQSNKTTQTYNSSKNYLKRFEIFLNNDETKSINNGKITTANDLFDIYKQSIGDKRFNQVVIKIQLRWINDSQSKKNNFKIVTNLEQLKDFSQMSSNESHVKLHDCIKLFTEPETLTSDNPWYCSNCKEHQKAKKQMSLWKLPRYLIITLKRFHANKTTDTLSSSNVYLNYLIQNRLACNKLNTFVDYPIKNLNMSQYIVNPKNQMNYVYDLCGIINHIGQSLYLGHYTAYSRTHAKSNTTQDELGWRLFDDAHVQTVNNPENIVSQDAYVLVYTLRNDDFSNSDNLPKTSEFLIGKTLRTPSTSGDEYFDQNSDESEQMNSHSDASSESFDKAAYTDLNDVD